MTKPKKQKRFKAERITNWWKKVDKVDGGCWTWTAATANGYGYFNTGSGMEYAHRLSWIIHKGLIPDGLWVLHDCDNRLCVNPDHLFLGTHQDNVDDMVSKGRNHHPKGVDHPKCKLTTEQVLDIRRIYSDGNITYKSIGEIFGVSLQTVQFIVNLRSWKHI